MLWAKTSRKGEGGKREREDTHRKRIANKRDNMVDEVIVGFVCYLNLWGLNFVDSKDPKSNRSIDFVRQFTATITAHNLSIPEIPTYSRCNIILEF